MRERNGNVKAQVIPNTGASIIQGEIRDAINPGTVLCTDENPSYGNMPEYTYLSVNHSAKEFVNGMAYTNGIESVWAVLKRGYVGTFHSFSAKHLQKYVDEFSFRLNEGKCAVKSMDRIDSMLDKTVGKRLTYKRLIGK